MAMEQSLFGPSAASVQDQLLQQDAAFGNNLTPVGLATAIGGSAGRHIGNLMGMEDPRVAKAKALQEVKDELRKQGLDATKPDEFYPTLIRKLNEKGLTEEAMNVANVYRSSSLEGAVKTSQIAKNTAEATKALRENESPAGRMQREYSEAVAKGDLERARMLKAAMDHAIQNNTAPFGVTEKDKIPVFAKDGKLFLSNPDGSEIPYNVKVHGGVVGLNGTKIDLGDKNTGQFWLKRGEDTHKTWTTDQVAFTKLAPSMSRLNELLKNPYFNGSMAAPKTELTRFAKMLGLTSEDDDKIVDNNDLLKILAVKIVLPKMKQLSGSDSNEELKALMAEVNERPSPQVLAKVVDWFNADVKKHKEIRDIASAKMKSGMSPEQAWATAYEDASTDVPAAEPPPPVPKPTAQPSGQKRYAISPQQYEAELRALGKLSEEDIQKRLRKYYPQEYK